MRGWRMLLGALGGLFGAAGVTLAAIGAHRSGNPNVTTAAYFLLVHATAVMALCALAHDLFQRAILGAGSLIALGVILFAGDLAMRALAGVTVVRLAAPTGGVLMIVGWLAAAVAVPATLRHETDRQ